MMKKIIVLLIILLGFSAQAQEKSKNAKYTIEVSGNCEQCKKRIEKAAYSVPGVKSAVWEAEGQSLNLILNEKKSSLTDVRTKIAKAGHDSEDIKATVADYDNLHHCCKYERK